MTYFEDLSPYAYATGEEVISIRKGFIVFDPPYLRLNVGWPSAGHPYAEGNAPEGLVDALIRLESGQRVNIMRGQHACEFCLREQAPLGNGEIRVPGEAGLMYAAPVMLSHYVAVHAYLPPEPFVSAVFAYAATNDRLNEPSWIPADAERELFA